MPRDLFPKRWGEGVGDGAARFHPSLLRRAVYGTQSIVEPAAVRAVMAMSPE